MKAQRVYFESHCIGGLHFVKYLPTYIDYPESTYQVCLLTKVGYWSSLSTLINNNNILFGDYFGLLKGYAVMHI